MTDDRIVEASRAVPVGAARPRTPPRVPRGRLVGWAIFVGILALISYAANFASEGDTPDDLLYRWSSAVGRSAPA